MITAGMYSSLINGNIPGAIGCAIMKDDFAENNSNTHETKNQKSSHIYCNRVKHTRNYIIPEDRKRCTAITKKGERCICRRLQEGDYCVTHNKKFKPRPIEVEKIVKEEPICKTWKNLYGLLK